MSWIRHLLRLDNEPAVTDDDRAEVAHLRDVTAQASKRANAQASEAHRLAGYFKDQNDRNHIAERLNIAIQRGR
jgi:hypothetical protein